MASPGESGSRICTSDEAMQNQAEPPSLQEQHDDSDRKARIEEVWKKMNSGMPLKDLKSLVNKPNSTGSIKTKTTTPSWMFRLGIAPAKAPAATSTLGKRPESSFNGSMEEAKKLAAAALLAAKDAGLSTIAGRGKVEITEVRDFAGEEIEVKKLVGADSEASEKARASSTPPTALDTVLEQIKKKTKLSVLDKTKKDWNEFKDENKGLEEELDAYKKSSNQYLDKVSFLERTDLREFERERDARLTLQARRRTDMREDDL
ncbi:craniofacial development protein 1-like isoform X1 [Zingiber officinale]|uniref:craniofacial development protein 1-like isoform X1 n=2 Tax=Zingiber officinale TaxID=94328 RepID=UPI001C4BAB49|nr:craniofacial development protein 1-like isoform X1 [Zingiber officinale]